MITFYCLFQILKVLAENAVAIRTKAMKCLTSVVEADPGVLARVSHVLKMHELYGQIKLQV